MAQQKTPAAETAPDQRKLNSIQAQRLSALSGATQKELAGETITNLRDRLQWKIDPELFLFRRVCGKVVKKDPIDGKDYPVPFATVTVEDTDCNFVSYFPENWRWGWLFPIFCRREVLATTKTDACGNFCVWIPRFDIDWILEWRKLRICFVEFFRRPTFRDYWETLYPGRVPPHDPGPLKNRILAGTAELPLSISEKNRTFGAQENALEARLDSHAFHAKLPPPLPKEFRMAMTGQVQANQKARADIPEAIRSSLAARLGVDRKTLEQFNPKNFIGPFVRCFDVFFPEWHLIFDVPDITFKVTQDVNGDGVEETIYSEGFFDVRWDATSIPDVTLEASAIALSVRNCKAPDIQCGNVPAILSAGLMSLTDASYFDANTDPTDSYGGYALRPNRPRDSAGHPNGTAQAPFTGVVALYGCVDVQNAKYYRVQYAQEGGPYVVQKGVTWTVPFGGGVHVVSPDSDGWYAVLSDPDPMHQPLPVLEWPTPLLGKFLLKVDIADVGKHLIATSAPVAIQVDNTAPTVLSQNLKWKFSSEPDTAFNLPGRDLLGTCPTIHRGSVPRDVDVQFDISITAHHLRDAAISLNSCDTGGITPLSMPAPTESHWHDNVNDNSVSLTARYRIAATHLEGAYTFSWGANSRAMNPAGADGGNLVPPDWFYDPVYVWSGAIIPVAIVNE